MKKNININKTIITVITIDAVQIAIILGCIIYNINTILKRSDSDFSFLYIITIMVILNSLLTLNIIIRDKSESNMLKTTLKQLESLNTTLRAQRHDFMNHLQVVYSLMEMDEYKDAKDYIDKVYNDIQKVNQALKTLNPAVNALLQAKILYSEKRGIEPRISINTQLKDLKMPAWEFCRVLGNIIDNSIYSLQQIDKTKVLEIELFEDIKLYGFKIRNNGPSIPKEIMVKIFESGFTTKGDKGEGMGLAIARSLLVDYGGNIKVISDEKSTMFEGWIPK